MTSIEHIVERICDTLRLGGLSPLFAIERVHRVHSFLRRNKVRIACLQETHLMGWESPKLEGNGGENSSLHHSHHM